MRSLRGARRRPRTRRAGCWQISPSVAPASTASTKSGIEIASRRRRRAARRRAPLRPRPRRAPRGRRAAARLVRLRSPRRCADRNVHLARAAVAELVDPDDDRGAALDRLLRAVRRVGDAVLHPPALDRVDAAAERVDFGDQIAGAVDQRLGQRFDVVRAGHRVDDVGDAALVADDLLRAQGDAGRLGGRQAPALRPCRWCAATACRRAPPRAPASSPARRCCRVLARSASSRRSACGSAASTTRGPSRRTLRARCAPRGGARRGTWRSPRRSRCARSRRTRCAARSRRRRARRRCAACKYAFALASVNAISSTAVEPASRMW